MFKRVESEWELTMFNSIWTTVWKEKNYELEYSASALERYVALSNEGEYVGCAEYKRYEPGSSSMESVIDVRQHPLIAANLCSIGEIEKMAVLMQYRGHPLADLLSSAVQCAEKHQIRYYLALLEPIFYRALRITFHVPMERLGEKAFYKGDYVIPTLIRVEEVYNNKSQYDWLVLQDDPSKPGIKQ
ncbi:hypothetical protein [Paenibacillus sp. NPDC058071]|uniref:hypothetical protein n=1 Tax=Paenibacillus sp. NPDC058071 TaxID=3346326 RepID=UPI0036DAE4A3